MTTPPTISGAMDAPLTVLMRAAVRLSSRAECQAEREMIVASVQVLEAVRLSIAAKEGAPICPRSLTTPLSSAAVVDLRDFRATRATHTPDIGGTG